MKSITGGMLATAMFLAPLPSVFGQQGLGLAPTQVVLTQGANGKTPATPILVENGPAFSDWYVNADALIWTRSMPNGPLFINQYTGATVFDTSSVLRFGWSAGPNITLGRFFDETLSYEVSYFGLYGWGARGNTLLGGVGPNVPNPGDPTRQIAAEILPFRNFTVGGAPGLTFDPGDTQRYDYRFEPDQHRTQPSQCR